jgi:hypothetical protein
VGNEGFNIEAFAFHAASITSTKYSAYLYVYIALSSLGYSTIPPKIPPFYKVTRKDIFVSLS